LRLALALLKKLALLVLKFLVRKNTSVSKFIEFQQFVKNTMTVSAWRYRLCKEPMDC
jgi:hypothetical protein